MHDVGIEIIHMMQEVRGVEICVMNDIGVRCVNACHRYWKMGRMRGM
jgi:hypothetical protein